MVHIFHKDITGCQNLSKTLKQQNCKWENWHFYAISPRITPNIALNACTAQPKFACDFIQLSCKQ